MFKAIGGGRKLLLVVVTVLGLFATSCGFQETPVLSDPGFQLRHDYGPYPVIQKGLANSCLMRDSNVEGRDDICRVIEGYEAIGDYRNWLLKGADPIAVSGSDTTSRYGYAIVFENGLMYEGCDWRSPDNSWLCDYRVKKFVVNHVGEGGWKWALRKTWDWVKYAGNTAGCAGGIASVWSGSKVTLSLLTGCADGPL